MYALLDNSDSEVVRLGLATPAGGWEEAEFTRSTHDLLGALHELLLKKGSAVKDLTGIAVVVGVGRFTATRVATVVGNTLAYALGIPVVAVPTSDPALALERLQTAKTGKFVVPVYSAEAHIGGIQQAP